MSKQWVLVANGSEARLFRRDGKSLELAEEFLHPESRAKDQEITSDHSSHRETRSDGTAANRVYGSFPESTDPHDFEMERFARQLAEAVDAHRARSELQELVIVAPPRFHGKLNQHLPEPLAKCIVGSLEKDYTKVETRDLPGQIGPHLGW